jgi:hypothetical protein
MAMKPIFVVVACVTLMSSTAPPVSTKEQILVTKLDFYMVEGSISDETPLADNVWPELPGEELPATKMPPRFFSQAELDVAGVRLRAEQNSWRWDAKTQPPKDAGIELLSSPKIASIVGRRMAVFVGSARQIQYFERRPDGLFELKTSDAAHGIHFAATVDKGESSGTFLCDMKVHVSLVGKRLPIEGVTLDVGVPVVTKRESRTQVNLKAGEYYGMLLDMGDQRTLLTRIRVDFKSQT